MSVDQQVAQRGVAEERFPVPQEALSPFEPLNRSVAVFLSNPAVAEREAAMLKAIEPVARAACEGLKKLRQVRALKRQSRGGYALRYVCTKRILDDGTLESLPRPRPARDRTLAVFQQRISAHPDRFPDGLAGFLRETNPLYTADTRLFSRLAQIRIREQLSELPGHETVQAARELADVLDLLATYRHCFLQSKEASPTALAMIDKGDVASMQEFLMTAAARAPFTAAEFSTFLRSLAAPSPEGDDEAVLLRGRIVNSGLSDTPGILKRWITPFARELSLRGLIPDLEHQYQQRLVPTPVSGRPQPTKQQASSPSSVAVSTVAPSSVAPAPSQTWVAGTVSPAAPKASPPPQPEVTEEEFNSDSGIPISAVAPPRLSILKSYLEIGATCSVLSLQEAMRIAVADPSVEGHRQHVLKTFRQAGWTIIPRKNREPLFEKRTHERRAGTAPASNDTV